MIRVEFKDSLFIEPGNKVTEAAYIGLDLGKFHELKRRYQKELIFIDYKRVFQEVAEDLLEDLRKIPGELSILYSKIRWNRVRISESNFYVLKSLRNIVLYFSFLRLCRSKNLLIIVESLELYNFFRNNPPPEDLILGHPPFLKSRKIDKYGDTFDYIEEKLRRRWRKNVELPKSDITLLQVYTNYSLAESKEPFGNYYDKLDSWLADNGENVWFLVTVLEHEKYEITRAKIVSKYKNCIFINDLLSRSDVIKIGIEDLYWGARTPSIYIKGIDVGPLFEDQEIRGPAISNKIAHSYYLGLKNIIKKGVKINKYIYVMENKCWERNSIIALRRYSPETFIIGFQHTQLPEFFGYTPDEKLFASHAKPDRIVCTGAVSANILKEFWGNEVEVCIGPALRNRQFQDTYDNFTCSKHSGDYNVGVAGPMFLPEAIELLADMLGILAESGSSFNVLYKIHPVTSETDYKDVIDMYPEKVRQSFKFFKGDVKEFFQSIDLFVSSGTTMEIQAGLLGIPTVFYVSFNNFKYTHMGFNSNIASDFEDLKNKLEVTMKNKRRIRKLGTSVLQSYYNPICNESLKQFLPP